MIFFKMRDSYRIENLFLSSKHKFFFVVFISIIISALIPTAPVKAQNTLNNIGLPAVAPSATFSFRKLSSAYTGDVIRVRRSTDNAEANIAFDGSNELSAASNVNFIPGITLLNTSSFTAKTGTLNVTNGSSTVTGTGTLFTTELSPGDVLADNTSKIVIGTVASIANDVSLTLVANATATLSGIYKATPSQVFSTFYNGGSTICYVKTWYDQSGNGKNATAPADTAQPLIVKLGGLLLKNSKPILTWNSTAQVLNCDAVTTTVQTVNAVRNLKTIGWSAQTLFACPKAADFSIRNGYSPTLNANDWVNSTGTIPANWVNGVQTMTGTIPLHTLTARAATSRTNNFSISSTFNGSGMTGDIGVSEMILFPGVLADADKEILECDQLHYFSIINSLLTFLNQTTAICSGKAFNAAQAPVFVKYTWSAPVVSPAGSVTGSSAQATPVSTCSQTLTNITNAQATVTYSVTPTLCGEAGTPFTITVTVNPLPGALPTITTDYCTGTGFVKLTSSPGTAYLWSTGQTTQVINVANSGNYTVATSQAPYGCATIGSITVAQELVTNGNFNAGNTGFTSAYANNQTTLIPEGNYAVATDANALHFAFHGKDHTTGNGNFMMINGIANALVWGQNTIAVQPNTTYYFSAWGLALQNINNAVLQFSVNGFQTGSIAYLTNGYTSFSGPFTWTRFYGQWNSGPSTSVNISIVNLNPVAGGNDFGLDDISFGTLSPVALSAAPIQNSGNAACQAASLYLASNVTGGASPYTYSWTGPNAFSSTAQNPVVTAGASAANNGSYNLTVTDGFGCTVNAATTVSISALPLDKTTVATVSPLCSGGTSAITVSATEVGVTYQLKNALNTDVGAPLPGDGNTITLPAGAVNATSTFSVVATKDNSGCSVPMSSPVTVTVSTTPVLKITNQAVCSGTVNLTLPAVTAGSTGGGALSYWTDAAATIAAPTPASITASGTFYIKSSVGSCSDIEPVAVSISSSPSAAFSYPVDSICNSNTNPFPIITGVAGVFTSSPSGLSFVNASTGQINLVTSLPKTYTITNTVGASGCTSSSTFKVIIKALPKAGFSYGSTNDLCQVINLANQMPTLTDPSTSGFGTFYTTTGLTIANSLAGSINVNSSTPGNYAIWRIIPAAGGCPSVSDTTFLDINPYTNTGIVLTSASASTLCLGQPINLYSTPVPYVSVLFKEKFNSAILSWTKTNNSTGGTIANATWTTRANNYSENAETFSSNDNSNFISTSSFKQGAGTTETILRSASMSTVGFSTLQLDFFQYFKTAGNGTATVEVSVNNATWVAVATYNSTQGTSSAFINAVINLNAYIGQPIFYLRFRYNAQYDGSWSIDNVSLTGNSTNYTYGWSSSPAGFTSSAKDPVAVVPAANTFYVLTAINSYGCPQPSVPVPVTVQPSPTLTGIQQPTVACIGNGASITLTGLIPNSNSTVTYSINGVLQTPVGGVVANAGGVASFISNSLTASNNGQELKITLVDNGTCTSAFSTIKININVQTTVTWSGTINSDWFEPQNWCGGVPTSITDITIPNGLTNYPEITSGTAVVKSIVIQSAASLLINGGKLTVSGAITNTAGGVFDAQNGTLEMQSSALQNISGTWFANSSIKNLQVSNTSVPNGLVVSNVAGNYLKILDSLTFGTSNATLTTGDNVVLVSSATGTARVADITKNGAYTGNKFTGNVTVERYYPARRAWRLVTAPLSSTGSVYNTWQNGGAYAANRGTYVTGNPVANGLDASPQNNVSLKQGTALTPILNTFDTLLSTAAASAANKAFFLFVRGDRTASNLYTNSFNHTTLSSKGKLQTGTQLFNTGVLAAGGLAMLGNPYASPVDFYKTTRTNLDNVLYVWDPNLGGANNVGGYVLLDDMDNDGNYSATPASPGGLTNILQSSQAFIVRATAAGAASLTFEESHKSDVNNTNAFRPARQSKYIRVNLHQLEQNDSTVLTDGVLVQFDNNFNTEIDNMDAVKLGNVNEMLSIQKGAANLTLERRPDITENDTIYLKLTKTRQRTYRLQFVPADLGAAVTAFIEDSYTNTKTDLSIGGTSNYDFTINGDAKSAAANRFKIVFKQTGLTPLPVTFKNIKAYEQGAAIAVEWKVENEINIRKYEVEKSIDGTNFKKVNTTAASGAASISTTYNWLDVSPANGNNFYRIRSIGADGKYDYSGTVLVKKGKLISGVNIYPNPVTNGVIGTEFKNMTAGNYNVRLLNDNGQVLLVKTINHPAGTSMNYIRPGQKLVSGIYQLEVTAPDKTTSVIKVIVQ